MLKLTCRSDGTTDLHTPTVLTRPDGVHVQVDNQAGETVSVNGLGWDFDEGVSEETLSVPPGRVMIACWPLSAHGGGEPERVPVRIVDPEANWVPIELQCPNGLIASTISDFFAGSEGTKGDPVEIVREQVRGLKPSDLVEIAAYPDQPEPVVRIVRRGKVVAVANLTRAEGGGYLFGGFSSCSKEGLRQQH